MNRIKENLVLWIVFTAVWVVLNEQWNGKTVLVGMAVAFLSLRITDRYLLHTTYEHKYYLSPVMVAKYIAYLVVQIYKSGFSSIVRIVKGENDVMLFDYETVIQQDLPICLLANAITLTPGTVTVDKKGKRLRILTFCDGTDACESKVDRQFERILSGGKR